MHEKSQLLNSMDSLINHIKTSKNHQQQIFKTFTKNDFSKILVNLDDSNENIRKVTLTLISLLLYGNIDHQISFCDMTDLIYIPGKLVLTSQPILYSYDQQILQKVLDLLKAPIEQSNLFSLYWFIDTSQYPPIIKFIDDIQTRVDPMRNISGIILHEKSKYIPLKHSLQKYNNNKTSAETNNQTKQTIQSNNLAQSYYQEKQKNKKYSLTQRIYGKSYGINATVCNQPAYKFKSKKISQSLNNSQQISSEAKSKIMNTVKQPKTYIKMSTNKTIQKDNYIKGIKGGIKSPGIGLSKYKQMQLPLKYIKTQSRPTSSNTKNKSMFQGRRHHKQKSQQSVSPRNQYF